MSRRPLLRLLVPGALSPDRIFHHSVWFHNNPRYAELFPRIDRLDSYPLVLPEPRPPGVRSLRGSAFA